jgi:uroporphyrinogen-III synthase
VRLLVTRPEPDAARTAARLRATGHDVIVHPLLTVEFNAAPSGLPVPGAIIITSQNAVRAIAGWPQASEWRQAPVFAAGAATAAAVAALGFTDVRGGASDAASLAELLLTELSPDAGPLIYPAARDRVGALAGGLMAKAYDVRTIEAYRAEAVQALDNHVRQALVDGLVEGILLFSARTARAFLDLASREGLAAALAKPDYFVLSDHIAGLLDHSGASIHVAERPNEDSLLALIPDRP